MKKDRPSAKTSTDEVTLIQQRLEPTLHILNQDACRDIKRLIAITHETTAFRAKATHHLSQLTMLLEGTSTLQQAGPSVTKAPRDEHEQKSNKKKRKGKRKAKSITKNTPDAAREQNDQIRLDLLRAGRKGNDAFTVAKQKAVIQLGLEKNPEEAERRLPFILARAQGKNRGQFIARLLKTSDDHAILLNELATLYDGVTPQSLEKEAKKATTKAAP